MRNRDAVYATAAALGGLAGALIATRVARAFQRDQRIALAQLMARSDVLETARGPVEWAASGQGPAVLVIHGGGGGYDQGLHCAAPLGEAGVRFIAPSRFGYLRSPLPPNATPEAQADALAALLDSLGLERAGVLAFSAGGMTAVNFALRHPRRCWGLILASAITHAHVPASGGMQGLGEALLGNDFFTWALGHWPKAILAGTGTTEADLERLGDDEAARRGLFSVASFPLASRRRDGLINDLVQAEVLPDYPLANVAAPTLLIHGTHDPFIPFEFAAQAAATIPGAQLLTLEGAGHLGWFTHAAQTRPAALAFLAAHAPHP